MERKALQPHEVFAASWDEIFKQFFNRMEDFERKTKSAEHAAEESEVDDANLCDKP